MQSQMFLSVMNSEGDLGSSKRDVQVLKEEQRMSLGTANFGLGVLFLQQYPNPINHMWTQGGQWFWEGVGE